MRRGLDRKEEGPDAAWAASFDLTAALFGDVERGRAAAPLGDLRLKFQRFGADRGPDSFLRVGLTAIIPAA